MTKLFSFGLRRPAQGSKQVTFRCRGVALFCLPFLAWVGTGCITDVIRSRGIAREYRASYEECWSAIEAAIAEKTPLDGTRIRLKRHRRENGWIVAERALGWEFIVERALHDGFLLERRSIGITSIQIYSTRMDTAGRLPMPDNQRTEDWHAALAKRLSPVK